MEDNEVNEVVENIILEANKISKEPNVVESVEPVEPVVGPVIEPVIDIVTEVTEPVPVIDNVNIEEKVEIQDNSDVFITEDDTFDVRVFYYKNENDILVESVDDEFDPNNKSVKHFDITFKYPCQGDYEAIIAQNSYKTPDKMTLIDVMQMELTRLVVLIRKWSLNAEFGKMVELDTKIVKAIVNKVREKIGVKGIL